MVEQHGLFIEIFVETSLEECILRDTKGLYKKAKAGLIKNFTGVDDPYEIPKRPEFIAKTEEENPATIIRNLIKYCEEKGVFNIS
jgi:adenylylsulfate kinase-like enzyme